MNPREHASHPAKQGGWRYQDDVDTETAAGYDARCDGKPITDNPWHDRADDHHRWKSGWLDAHDSLATHHESVARFVTNLLEVYDDGSIDGFTHGYLVAALWTSTDDEGEPLAKKYSVGDIAPECIDKMEKDCLAFQEENREYFDALVEKPKKLSSDEVAGHNFWLTRSGNAEYGFWDGDYEPEAGKALTAACKAYDPINLYAENGQVFCHS